MLTEYLAEAALQERAAELRRLHLATEAARLNPEGRARFGLAAWIQARASRSRRAASTSGHSLSMME